MVEENTPANDRSIEVGRDVSNSSVVSGDGNRTTHIGSVAQLIQVSVPEVKTRPFNVASPYKGLKKFEQTDKDRFFGQEQFVRQLADALNQTNLLLLLGASGSGKSSVIRAGLVPELERQEGDRFIKLTFNPDNDPFESLYASLLSCYGQRKAQFVRQGKAETLVQMVETLKPTDTCWLIFVDQFEELFTTSKVEKCNQFIAGLVQLNQWLKRFPVENCQVKIVAAMRSDFLDRLSPYPGLVKATDHARPIIAELKSDELQLAIEQPAAHHGVVFEDGLVGEIIKSVQGQAGYLPLLQYTLSLLWKTELEANGIRDRTLTISTYRGLGGVRGALQKHVDQIYGALSQEEQLAAQRIFLKLVDIGKTEVEADWKPVRRRVLRSAFSDELEQQVLKQLVDSNLLVSDRLIQTNDSIVEVAHEILLTAWTTLEIWIQENRQAIALRNRLDDDVKRWTETQSEDELWSGSKLTQAWELSQDETFNQVLGGFNENTKTFIAASLEKRDRFRERELRHLEQLLAEEEKARRAESEARKVAQRLVVVVTLSALVVLIAIGSFICIDWLRREQFQQFSYDIWSRFQADSPDPKNLDSLNRFLEDAQRRAEESQKTGDIERSLAYYRQIRVDTVQALEKAVGSDSKKLQKPLAKSPDKEQKKLISDSKFQPIFEKAQKSEIAITKILEQKPIEKLKLALEEGKRKNNFGEIKQESTYTDFENRYTPSALQTTYKMLMRDWGAGADLNNDGRLNNDLEALQMPCEILRDIEKLWRKATGGRCGWYDLNAQYSNSSNDEKYMAVGTRCTEFNGVTLSAMIFALPGDYPAIDRLKACEIDIKE